MNATRLKSLAAASVCLLATLLASSPQAWAQLTITGVSPTANARAATRPGPVVISFSQPLAPSAASALKVYSAQRGGLRTSGATAAVVSGSTLRYEPAASPFLPGETVSSTVTTAAGSSGGTLARGRVTQFTAAVGGTGTGSFQTPATNANPGVGNAATDINPQSVALGDLDGDGDLDFVTANAANNSTASVRLNNGAGSFTPPAANAEVDLGFNARSGALADIDQDGDLDYAAVNYGSHTVCLRLNNGAGSFSPPAANATVAVGSYASDVVFGDLDADGDLDLVTANPGANTVSIRLNNGAGVFSPPTFNVPPFNADFAVGDRPLRVVLGDVDNDGDLDVLTSDFSDNAVSVRLNDGTGYFTAPAVNSKVNVGPHPNGLALSDLDGDGDLDFAAVNYDNNTVSLRFNNGSGSFTPAAGIPDLSVGFQPFAVALGDLDADGDIDLVTTDAGTASVRLNDGLGHFTPPATNPTPAFGRRPPTIVLGDVDGDGDLDVLTPSPYDYAVNVRLNEPTAPLLTITGTAPATSTHTAQRSAPVTASFSQPLAPAMGAALQVYSFQRGGRRTGLTPSVPGGNALTYTPPPARPFMPGEIVQATATTPPGPGGTPGQSRVTQFRTRVEGTGRGIFTLPVPDPNPGVGTAPTGVALADLDGDGDLDLLAANSGSNSVSVLLNNGRGWYTADVPPVAVDRRPLRVVAGDVDGDGDLDLVTANNYYGTVSVRLNDGNAQFTTPSFNADPYAVGHAKHLELRDVDGDSDLDLLVAGDEAQVLLNDGAGIFETPYGPPPVSLYTFANDVALGDLDNDGDLDLVGSYSGGLQAVVRLNNAMGYFTPPTSSPSVAVSGNPVAIALADLDTDGDLDLITVNAADLTGAGGSTSIRLNDGSGHFAGSTNTTTGLDPVALAIGDLDKDGDLDFVCANSMSNNVSVKINNGLATFPFQTTTPSFAVGNGPADVALGDVDGDGDLDVVTANENSNTVSVRLNGGTVLATPAAKPAAAAALYPNPALAGTSVHLTGPAGTTAELFDIRGRRVASAVADAAGNVRLLLPAELTPGLYLVRNGATTAALAVQ